MATATLEGKVVLVTGAAGGMGSVMSLALVHAGAKVAAADMNANGLEALKARADPSVAGLIEPFTVDLSDRRDAQGLVPRVLDATGRIDALVNNAGIGMLVLDPDYSHKPSAFWSADIDKWQRLFDVNVRAPLLLASGVMPHFLGRGKGRIINVTTSLDTMIAPKVWAYGQSKSALEAATSSWAAQLKDTGITVNILVPGGPVDTGLLPPDSDLPRHLLIQAEVMATPVCWLVSDAADGFTKRRVIANQWDAGLPPRKAAEAASYPAAWEGLGVQSIRPDSMIDR